MIGINTSWFRPIIRHAEVSMEPRDDASGGGRGNTLRIAGPQCTRHTGMVSGEDTEGPPYGMSGRTGIWEEPRRRLGEKSGARMALLSVQHSGHRLWGWTTQH